MYGTGEAPYGLYAVIGDDPDYNFIALSGIPDEWHYNEPDRQIQLVLCLDRIGTVHEVFCPCESQGTEWTVEAFSVNYQATLREAKTAAVIDSDTFYAKSDGCPFVSVFVDGQPDPKPKLRKPSPRHRHLPGALCAPIASRRRSSPRERLRWLTVSCVPACQVAHMCCRLKA